MIILVAREHAVSPTVILRRVAARKVQWLRQRALRFLGLDRPRIYPHTATAIWLWRSQRGRKPPTNTPAALAPVAAGTVGELSIAGVFPSTTCFVQLELPTLALRWSTLSEHCVFMHAVEELWLEEGQSKGRRSSSRSPRRWSTRSKLVATGQPGSMNDLAQSQRRGSLAVFLGIAKKKQQLLHIRFRDGHGLARTLVLSLPSDQMADWHRGLRNVLASAMALPASVGHRRWALSCMESVSSHGAGGMLRRPADLPALLNRVC